MKKSFKLVFLALTALSIQMSIPVISHANSEQVNLINSSEISNKDDLIRDLISEGYLKENNNSIEITKKYKDEVNDKIDRSLYNVDFTVNSVIISPKVSIRNFTGVNKVTFTKKGINFFINNENTNKIIATGTVGSGVLALLPEAAASKILSAITSIGSGVLAYTNSKGRGIVVSVDISLKPGNIGQPVITGLESQWHLDLILDLLLL